MPTSTAAEENHLLAALPGAVLQRWLQVLEPVDLPLGLALCESGQKLKYVYFPSTAIVSMRFALESGDTAEVAAIGSEGVVGISMFLGGGSTPYRAVVQIAGQGYRLSCAAMKKSFKGNGQVMHLMLRYTQSLIAQMIQSAACSRHHTLDNRLCRWLLLSMDRLQSHELVMTQGLIAHMVGERRAGITGAAVKLRKAGLIRYANGHITVLDRPGLEARACECYAVLKKELGWLLAGCNSQTIPTLARQRVADQHLS